MKLAVRIGITCNRVGYEERLSLAYVRAVVQSGAVPFLLPVCFGPAIWKQMISAVDAIVLSGGGDPDALHYGEEAAPGQGFVQPDRDSMELFMARAALRQKIPILGICRGAQIMTIAAGGTLWQSLKDVQKLQHDQRAPRAYPIHQVVIKPHTLLAEITKLKSFRVNSLHHQAVRHPGPGFIVSAMAKDGVIEAVEMPGHPFAIGVQWHPEWMCRTCRHASLLFSALKRAAISAK